jgi:hypothetical protein
MADLFSRKAGQQKTPITADRVTVTWGGVVSAAIQVQISYQQQINRRRTIGNQDMAIWANYPIGQITIARMICDGAADIFDKPGWDACTPADQISFSSKGTGCGNASGIELTAKHCIVSQYTISAEAEGLTVIDNIVIEFLELEKA